MENSLFVAFSTFAFVSLVTPGPNNLMLMASGANFGFVRSAPHMLGVDLGFAFMVAMVGFGLAGILTAYPSLYSALKAVSLAYLLYLAWKIAGSAGIGEARPGARPMTFFQAAGFQWVNPKAWAMALTAVTVYAPDRNLAAVALISLVFFAIGLLTAGLWVVTGREVRRWLTDTRRLRAFNIAMASLLLASL
ncbi:LysE family translocator, partial [Roseibium sp.]|uniref:LysE family translocator n=1 Tax=Roseibium sp. TaxID=1936156 RepID=UPI003D122B9C